MFIKCCSILNVKHSVSNGVTTQQMLVTILIIIVISIITSIRHLPLHFSSLKDPMSNPPQCDSEESWWFKQSVVVPMTLPDPNLPFASGQWRSEGRSTGELLWKVLLLLQRDMKDSPCFLTCCIPAYDTWDWDNHVGQWRTQGKEKSNTQRKKHVKDRCSLLHMSTWSHRINLLMELSTCCYWET